jgi:phosphopantothenoylcysteine decarboxylase/phosphopantothenate--cysteine ligase
MLAGKRILLIVGGGIAAYKSLLLIRLLKERGAAVTPVLTRAGAEFVTPLSLSALAGEKALQRSFRPDRRGGDGAYRAVPRRRSGGGGAGHRRPDGEDGGRARRRSGLDAPDGDRQARADRARDERADVGASRDAAEPRHADRRRHPDRGAQCRRHGLRRIRAGPDGRAAGNPRRDRAALGDGPLAGRHVLVTSGPTHEPIDPVRYIANRSSGAQGTALARALARWARG